MCSIEVTIWSGEPSVITSKLLAFTGEVHPLRSIKLIHAAHRVPAYTHHGYIHTPSAQTHAYTNTHTYIHTYMDAHALMHTDARHTHAHESRPVWSQRVSFNACPVQVHTHLYLSDSNCFVAKPVCGESGESRSRQVKSLPGSIGH